MDAKGGTRAGAGSDVRARAGSRAPAALTARLLGGGGSAAYEAPAFEPAMGYAEPAAIPAAEPVAPPAADPAYAGGTAAPAQPGDVYTETKTTSYGDRLVGSVLGVGVGIILFIASFFLLGWNEQRSLEADRALGEALSQVVTVSPGVVNPALEGKLVHLSGPSTSGAVADSGFAATVPGVLRLRRKVEMYQWQEDRQTSRSTNWGGSETRTTTYDYRLGWSEQPIRSGDFRAFAGHQNPPMPYQSRTIDAGDAHIGAYHLGPAVLSELDAFAPLAATEIDLRAPNGFVRYGESFFYRGSNPQAPTLGDLRLSYEAVRQSPVSIVGGQKGDGISAFDLAVQGRAQGDGYRLLLAQPGELAPAAMIGQAMAEEQWLTWLLRLAGFVVMTFGVVLFLGPLETLLSVVPLLGDIMAASLVVVALIITVPATLLTIAFSWLALRPLWAMLVIVLGLAGGLFFYRLAAR